MKRIKKTKTKNNKPSFPLSMSTNMSLSFRKTRSHILSIKTTVQNGYTLNEHNGVCVGGRAGAGGLVFDTLTWCYLTK